MTVPRSDAAARAPRVDSPRVDPSRAGPVRAEPSRVDQPLSVSAWVRHGAANVSSRLRLRQYLAPLDVAWPRVHIDTQALFDGGASAHQGRHEARGNGELLRAYAARARALLRAGDARLHWVEKELWPWAPAWLERVFMRGRPYVIDYDDATFHTYDQHPRAIVRMLCGRKIDRLMKRAALVVVGNDYLAERARSAGAKHVRVLPTVVELARYKPVDPWALPQQPVRIVWLGSPQTAPGLQVAATALAAVAREHPIELRVIGAEVDLPGVNVSCEPWREDTEATRLRDAHIGIAPLRDSLSTRGTCGACIVQYMACGLPVIASALPAYRSVLQTGVQGFIAESTEDWFRTLTTLVRDAYLRARMGRAGRERVERHYQLAVTAPLMHQWLLTAGGVKDAEALASKPDSRL